MIAGKYRVERTLGVGGTGVVVAARHLQLDAPVAIKLLLPEALANQEAVARFALEAQAAVKVKNEHVARVLDVGALEDGAPYMVMEYLDGSDLETWLAARGPLPTAQAVELVLQACEAVAEAHSLGIVHRDLKPANLFLIRRPDGSSSVKVLDFGISKYTAPDASEPRLTRPSALVGTPLYMSPEQLESSASTDARADIWALGVILYELLTGEAPFKGDSVAQVALEVVASATPSLRAKRADAPEGLERVIARCLEKDPAQRFENIAALALALLPFGPRNAGISLQRIRGVTRAEEFPPGVENAAARAQGAKPARTAKPVSTPSSWGRTRNGAAVTRQARLAWLVAALMLLTGMSLAGYVLWQKQAPLAPEAALADTPPHAALTTAPSSEAPSAATAPPTPTPAEIDRAPLAAPSSIAAAPSVAAAASSVAAAPPRPSADKPTPRFTAPRPSKTARIPARATAQPDAPPPPVLDPAPSAGPSVYDDRK